MFLFRRQKGSAAVMAHAGLALGDGTCVHARGTAYGVVRQSVNGYAWTHWASPWEKQETMTLEELTAQVKKLCERLDKAGL